MKVRTEPENRRLLLDSVIPSYFNVYSERTGRLVYIKPIKRLFGEWSERPLKKTVKIDYVLEPTERTLALGWDLGCVGVEVKGSHLEGSDFGRAVSQILDYQCGAFYCRDDCPVEEELSMIFMLGPHRFWKTEASILMQEGIGLIRIYPTATEVRFLHGNGSHPILTIGGAQDCYQRPRFGKGLGHR